LQIAGGEGEGQGFFVSLLSKAEHTDLPAGDPNQGELAETWWSKYSERLIHSDDLESPCFDIARLPPGEAAVFGDNLIFIPAAAAGVLPATVNWRGFALGKFSGGAARLSPRLRVLMRGAGDCPSLNVDEPEVIGRLLSGNSLSLEVPGRMAGLYFQGLPLGVLRVSGGRVMWSEK
jgi:16S rRNA (cytosine1407-C5)-methyltransferase